MLLVHQQGSVKVGELVRYTLTYTPSNDRILPTPQHLHVKIKNTSAIPLRAAWLHGPYVLHVATYPSTFNPHTKVEEPKRHGVPEYEPMLKAGGSWTSKLIVPAEIRETGADLGKRRSVDVARKDGHEEEKSMTWIIEITSQILFSNTASVSFEVLVGRDERSLELGFAAVAGHGHGAPGQIQERQGGSSTDRARRRKSQGNVQTAGVYSKAVRLVAEDTGTLWDKPPLPTWDEQPEKEKVGKDQKQGEGAAEKPRKKKKVHLVILTHGMHSNIGADMLFLKESLDATVKQARLDARERKRKYREQQRDKKEESKHEGSENSLEDTATAPLSGGQDEIEGANEDESDDEEETIVRGFTGNAVKTENGIQYLGKRLAKYILRFTFPDQPFLPVKKPLSRTLTDTFRSDGDKAKRDGPPSHAGSSVHHSDALSNELPYTFTSISFVGHSLGGLVQTYAIAYIHKHSPTFFMQIKPVNFIALASPMLGLSNENPLYVKFALDFGLVGKTGQDLGLTWRPNTLARGGWHAMIGGLGSGGKDGGKDKQKEDPAAKPLLRILPTGPAHQVLRMFRNRTVYSNVVNDGIVPLRTSCLLFLDWRGLGKVDKARRENGLIGTVAEWGWAELTGANAGALRSNVQAEHFADDDDDDNEHVKAGDGATVPLPAADETAEDNKRLNHRLSYDGTGNAERQGSSTTSTKNPPQQTQQNKGIFDSFLDYFRSSTPERSSTPPHDSKRTRAALRRGQTINKDAEESTEESPTTAEIERTSNPTMRPHLTHSHTAESSDRSSKRPLATRGDSFVDTETGEPQAPPKTSIFESAGDILHPPLPSQQWITDPSSRSRTIFHDRVYHPEDIPPPPHRRPGSRLARSLSSESVARSKADSSVGSTTSSTDSADGGGMKVEEKIARAYHRDLSWRKVLVRLEPDAHNNIIVRRMFANAYGWPVVKHLCDTHFGDTYSARTRDEEEPARERARPMDEAISPRDGEQVEGQTDQKAPRGRSESEMREACDELAGLDVGRERMGDSWSSRAVPGSPGSRTPKRQDSVGSVVWDDSVLGGDGTSDDDADDVDDRHFVARMLNPNAPAAAATAAAAAAAKEVRRPQPIHAPPASHSRVQSGRPPPEASARQSYTDGHRGLAPRSPTTPRKAKDPTSPTVDAAHVDPAPATPIVDDHLESEPQPIVDGLGSPPAARKGLGKSIEESLGSVSTKK